MPVQYATCHKTVFSSQFLVLRKPRYRVRRVAKAVKPKRQPKLQAKKRKNRKAQPRRR
jgi:hypothetical protein